MLVASLEPSHGPASCGLWVKMADLCEHVRAGWLNVVGQFACTSGSGYLTAKHMAVMWQMGNGHVLTPFEMFLAYASGAPLLLVEHLHIFTLSS